MRRVKRYLGAARMISDPALPLGSRFALCIFIILSPLIEDFWIVTE